MEREGRKVYFPLCPLWLCERWAVRIGIFCSCARGARGFRSGALNERTYSRAEKTSNHRTYPFSIGPEFVPQRAQSYTEKRILS